MTPSFYDPNKIGTLFYPDTNAIVQSASDSQLAPASGDSKTVHLVLIDMQVDFCHPSGNLYVPGAEKDVERVCDFIIGNAGQITKISSTLDSHLPFQIFHPAWWVDADGQHPAPFTLITHQDVLDGKWRAVVLGEYSAEYTRLLEQTAKKVLTIWPYHTLIGSPGHMLDPMLWSTVTWHALARQTQPTWVSKGTIAQTEHYSAVQPEIPVAHNAAQGRNIAFLESLEQSDQIIIAGEAESHCVLATLADIVNHFADDRAKLESIIVLKDCMSPVLHPDVDFHAIAWAQFEQFAALGVRFVDSTEVQLMGHSAGGEKQADGILGISAETTS